MRVIKIVFITTFLMSLIFGYGFTQSSEKSSVQEDRYFRRDTWTATDYYWLRSDGTYKLIAREHMGIFILDKGTWSQDGDRIKLVSNKKNTHYYWQIIKYKGLSIFTDKDAEIVKKELDDPEGYFYGFIEIDRETFEKETKTNQPFIFHPEMNEKVPKSAGQEIYQ